MIKFFFAQRRSAAEKILHLKVFSGLSVSARKTIHLILFLVLFSVGLFASERKADELILISPHWDGIQYEFTRAFEEDYRKTYGREVHLRWKEVGGTSQIEKVLNASYLATPESCGIDLFFGGGMDPYENQKRKGHLQRCELKPEIGEGLPSSVRGIELVDVDSMYFGTALASFGFLENVPLVRRLGLPEVKTWEDLADPRLRGWVSASDPRKSGSVHMIYELILQAYGWEKGWAVLYGLGGNTRSFLQTSSAPTKEVALGEAAYAITIDINGMTQQAFLGKDRVSFRVPEHLAVIVPDGIAILKGAPHAEVAKAFVNFVLSEKGQRLWMTPKGSPGGSVKYGISRMGVLPVLYEDPQALASVPMNPFSEEGGLVYDREKGAKRWSVLNELIGATIIDLHPQLRKAWATVQSLPEPRRSEVLKKLQTPMISEEEANEMAGQWRKDPALGRRTVDLWMRQARARWEAIGAGKGD